MCETMRSRPPLNRRILPSGHWGVETTILTLVLVSIAVACAGGVETPWVMYEDPMLEKTPIAREFPAGLVDVWLQALARPEREMKRRAALAIAEGRAEGRAGVGGND